MTGLHWWFMFLGFLGGSGAAGCVAIVVFERQARRKR
jgi:hypothetical protein